VCDVDDIDDVDNIDKADDVEYVKDIDVFILKTEEGT
jgi:hypothetical protein